MSDAAQSNRVLQGHTALATGGGRGLSRGIALQLARAGASVAVVARTRAQLESVVDEIEAAGGRSLAVTVNVSDREAVEAGGRLTENILTYLDLEEGMVSA